MAIISALDGHGSSKNADAKPYLVDGKMTGGLATLQIQQNMATRASKATFRLLSGVFAEIPAET
ncbi:hypothetical protein [Granulicella sp. L46]|jgi:hypothetical protein|uniref:hypothetical protein n=1 Tax=Granulicella sp. L46 TaxID=1641865 RepID=UPI00131E54BA|nr:hypothetical protein [Granulicella sp. L46]